MNAVALRIAAGHYAWLERRLFEVLGGWVPSVREPEAKMLLRAQSFEHAWHADLWEELAVERPAGPWAGPVGASLKAVVEVVAAPSETVERLAGVYRVVLPRLVDAYGAISDAAVPASDGPLVRAVGLMLADDVPAIEDAERLLGELAGDPAAVVEHQRRVGGLLAELGGVGPRETS
ncbi:MAG: hypothetical protein ACRD2W_13705 [Acidimicrobiales bacterium]